MLTTHLSMKKDERKKRKKKKLAALVNIMNINKMEKDALEKGIEIQSNDSSDEKTPIKKMKFEIISETMQDNEYNLLKKNVRGAKETFVPMFRLNSTGEKSSLNVAIDHRRPLIFQDIQNLLMYSLLKRQSPVKPNRWSCLENSNKIAHTIVLVVDGFGLYDFQSNESSFSCVSKIFEHKLELIPAGEKIVQEILLVPWMYSEMENIVQKFGSLEAALMLSRNPNDNNFFSIDYSSSKNSMDCADVKDQDNFPRTQLLLSPLQMIVEGYPLPQLNNDKYSDFRTTKKRYKPVTKNSPMFGLDCEMVRSQMANNELARVSIVDENYNSVYETLVRPSSQVVNYLTEWSGVTKEMLDGATKTLKDVQDEVCELLPPDAILVGQSLNCDLKSMKLMHPYCIDTSIIYNLTGDRQRKSKLQLLAKEFLDQEIQMSKLGHSSLEDSTACLKLTKLKLARNIYYGDLALESKRIKITEKLPIPNQQVKAAFVTTHNCKVDLNQIRRDILTQKLEEFGIMHHKEPSAKRAIKRLREAAVENDFCLSYINAFEDVVLRENEEQLLNESEKIVPFIDKCVDKAWDGVAKNGLFVVIFNGRDGCNSNGVAFIKIKT